MYQGLRQDIYRTFTKLHPHPLNVASVSVSACACACVWVCARPRPHVCVGGEGMNVQSAP